ncbi:hypothetical protein JMJ77_0013528, partial [Colletotrichum scovillei]
LQRRIVIIDTSESDFIGGFLSCLIGLLIQVSSYWCFLFPAHPEDGLCLYYPLSTASIFCRWPKDEFVPSMIYNYFIYPITETVLASTLLLSNEVFTATAEVRERG